MRKYLLSILLVICPFFVMDASAETEPVNLAPKDEPEITRPIKRSPLKIPTVGIDGTTLVRLQPAIDLIYHITLLQNNGMVYSIDWNFQDETLDLPYDLRGVYEIDFSDGTKSFVGTICIR